MHLPLKVMSRVVLYLAVLCLSASGPASSALAQNDGAGTVGQPEDKKETRPQAASASPETHIRVRSVLVTTPVTVLNLSGDYVLNLEANDFEVLDNGAPQRIENFELELSHGSRDL